MNSLLLPAAIAVLAFAVGFASQRGSVCGVLAARQIVETGRFSRLVAFVTASFWAMAVALPLAWLLPGTFSMAPTHPGLLPALAGGALYGLGTVVNGACVFGTFSRILSGNLSFLAVLPGIATGAGLGLSLGLPLLRSEKVASPLAEPGPAGLAAEAIAIVVVIAAAVAIVRSHRRAGLGLAFVLRAARWRTSFSMMVIGVLGGVLFATGFPWSYPSFLRQAGAAAFGLPASFALATLVGVSSLVAGGVVSALAGGRFAWRAPRLVQSLRCLAGGTGMGLAATFVPGGNDSLLLGALPAMAWHGAAAYVAMMAVQLGLLAAAKAWKDRAARAWATAGSGARP